MALDTDDEVSQDFYPWDDKIIVSYKAREDSIGEKYNRCQRIHRADLYVIGCDDTVISTPGWDWMLLNAAGVFDDGIAIVYFGDTPGVFQAGIAVSHDLVEEMGYFCPPYFSYWWSDTWLHEIGSMIGRIVKTNVEIEHIGPIKASRGVRDIPFWAKFFDDTRPWRREIAERILSKRLDRLSVEFEQGNSKLRNADSAALIETEFGFDAPESERYLRLKGEAERLIGEINGTSR